MSKVALIVEHVESDRKNQFAEQDAWEARAPQSRTIEEAVHRSVAELLAFLRKPKTACFDSVERRVIACVFALGRLFLAFFFAWQEEHSTENLCNWEKQGYKRANQQPRLLGTFFGKVRYWRTYMKERSSSGGLYPLDLALGLMASGFSLLITSLSARLATLVPYDQVTGILMSILSWSPSKTTVEKAVLGLGKHTPDWFAEAPAPKGDGEVLVIQIDSKATPTATDSELSKRRGKRRKNPYPKSPRHRGRCKRALRGHKPRRKKGDKSKNGKAATLVVMYTLKKSTDKDGKAMLLGPLNRKVYASYRPKRHAFEIARREADKRGFQQGSGKLIQIVSDGDEDLKELAAEFFPGVIHTLDVMHVVEYLWEAAGCLFKEGSPELIAWVEKMKKLLYAGKPIRLVERIVEALAKVPRTGPGNLKKRKTLERIRDYLIKRVKQMNYDWLRAEDLEIASGSVEGAVKHVIAKRFDNGSMRWIRERAEALLQLRCIEINGDWEEFIAFVHQRLTAQATEECRAQNVLSTAPASLSGMRESA